MSERGFTDDVQADIWSVATKTNKTLFRLVESHVLSTT
jgi:hypothetical protein